MNLSVFPTRGFPWQPHRPLRLDPMDRITAAEALYLGLDLRLWFPKKKNTPQRLQRGGFRKNGGLKGSAN